MQKNFELIMISMPNFIKVNFTSDGGTVSMQVEQLTREEAEEYAEEMKKEFISHWDSKRRVISDAESKAADVV